MMVISELFKYYSYAYCVGEVLFIRSINKLLTYPDDFGHNYYFVSPILMPFEALES